MSYKAEYIWIDGQQPTAKLRSKGKIVPDGEASPGLGLRRLQHQPGSGRELGLRAQPGSDGPGPGAWRRQQAGDVRSAAHRHVATPVQHQGRLCRRRREVRQPGLVVRHRAGIHLLRRHQALGLAGQRLSRAPGRLLLRRRLRRGLRPARGGTAHGRLPVRRVGHFRYQRRGHAGPVGVPDRSDRRAHRCRPPVAGTLAALSHRRGRR